MATKKSSKTIYNKFYEKFKRKQGYIGSLLKNTVGNPVFEFEFDNKQDVEDAKIYLSENKCKYVTNSLNSKKILVKL